MDFRFQWLAGFEPSLIGKTATELGSVGEPVTALSAHPTQDLVLLGTESGRIVLWDPSRAQMGGELLAHGGAVTRIEFSPNQQQFVTASSDATIKLWNAEFEPIGAYDGQCPVSAVGISPNGQRMAAGGDDKVLRVWDLYDGALLHVLEGQKDPITSLLWVTNQVVVCGGSVGGLWPWEVDNKRTVRQQRVHEGLISHIIRSNTGGWYVTSSWDKRIRVFNANHRERFSFPDGSEAVTGIALTADERYLVASYWDGTVRVFNVESGQLHDEFIAHEEPLVGCGLLAGGDLIVTADQSGLLRSWDLREMGSTRYVNQHGGEVYSVRYTPDNLHLLSVGQDGHLKLWDRNQRNEAGYVEAHDDAVTAVAVSPDNRYWAVGCGDGMVKIWDVAQESFEITFRAHDQVVSTIWFLPDEEWLITGSWDMKLKLWILRTRQVQCTYIGHTKEVSASDLSLDSRRMISVSWDSSGRSWDLLDRGREIVREQFAYEGHTERILCCSISPDGRTVATGSGDRSVRIWQTDRVAEPRSLFGHSNGVSACRFSPDGLLLLTADRDGRVLAWETTSYQCLGELQHDMPILAIDIAPDAAQAVIGDEAGRVRFIHIDYAFGPGWIAAQTRLKPPPLWKRGSRPTEIFEVSCVFCGNQDILDKKALGNAWKCGKCGNTMMVCPQAFPPAQ